MIALSLSTLFAISLKKMNSFVKTHGLLLKILLIFFSYSPIIFITVFHLNTNITDDTTYLYGSYYDFYQYIYNGGNTTKTLFQEPLSWFLISFFAKNKISYFLMLFILNTIYVLSFIIFIEKNCTNRYISIFLFFATGLMTLCFSALRQALAMSFILLAYSYLIRKKEMKLKNWLVVFLILFLGSLFHFSCILVFPFLLIAKLKINNNFFMLLCLIMIIGFPVFNTILVDIISLTRFSGRLTREQQSFTITYLLIGIVLAVVFYHMSIRMPKYSFFFKYFMFFTVLMFYSSYLIDPYRIFQLFAPMIMIGCSYLITDISKKSNGCDWLISILPIIMFIVYSIIIYYDFEYNTYFFDFWYYINLH